MAPTEERRALGKDARNNTLCKTTRCICQICICGRHRCPIHPRAYKCVPAKRCLLTEYKERYNPWELEKRESCKPAAREKEDLGPMEGCTTNRIDYGYKNGRPGKSCRPDLRYCGPCAPLEDITSYRKNYTPKEGGRQRLAKPNLGPIRSHAPLDDRTIHRENYRNYDWQEQQDSKQKLQKPEEGLGPSDQPLEDQTTHRTDYQPKKGDRQLVRAPHQLHTSDAPLDDRTMYRDDFYCKPLPRIQPAPLRKYCPSGKFEDITTHRTDYTPQPFEANPSCKPPAAYQPPTQPLDNETTNRYDFPAWATKAKEIPPWARKKEYCPSGEPMEDRTQYRQNFMPHDLRHRQGPIRPLPAIVGDRVPIDDRTMYRGEFLPWGTGPAKTCKVDEVYECPTTKFGGDTTYKGDYQGEKSERVAPILPQTNCKSEGDLETRTHYRDEYKTVKCPAIGLANRSNTDYRYVANAGDHELFHKVVGEHVGGGPIVCIEVTPSGEYIYGPPPAGTLPKVTPSHREVVSNA